MVRAILEWRGVLAMVAGGGIGVWGLHAYPVAADNAFLRLVEVRTPVVYGVLVYGYAALWLSSAFLVASLDNACMASG